MERFDALDAFWFRIEATLARGACFVVHVSGNPVDPSWAYTVGFLERGAPELVTIGLSPESSQALLTWAFEAHAAGDPLLVGREHRRECGPGLPVGILELAPDRYLPPSDLVSARWGYSAACGTGFAVEPRVHQLVWPDDAGRLPWDAGHDPALAHLQPLLDEVPWARDRSHDGPCWGCALAEDDEP